MALSEACKGFKEEMENEMNKEGREVISYYELRTKFAQDDDKTKCDNEKEKAETVDECSDVIVYSVDDKVDEVAYQLADGTLRYVHNFNCRKYSRDDIDKYFCIYLDGIFCWLEDFYEVIDFLFMDRITPDLNNSYELAYSMYPKQFSDYGDKIAYAMDYIGRRVIKDSYKNFVDYLKNVYSKYGKHKMAILSSDYICGGEVICLFGSVEYIKDVLIEESINDEELYDELYYPIHDKLIKEKLSDEMYVKWLRYWSNPEVFVDSEVIDSLSICDKINPEAHKMVEQKIKDSIAVTVI